ncbi:slipin family protein, partial [Streptomyces sp. SAS_270]
QLRLLQTVVAVAAEKNSTLVLPFPVELLRFLERAQQAAPQSGPQQSAQQPGQGPLRAVPEAQEPTREAEQSVQEQLPPRAPRLDSDPDASKFGQD